MTFLKKIAAAFYAVRVVFVEILFGIIGATLSLFETGRNAYDFYLSDSEGPEENK